MDDELFESIYHIARRLWPGREPRVQYAGRLIVLLYLWSAIRNSCNRSRRAQPSARSTTAMAA